MIVESHHTQNDIVLEQQFAQIDAIITSHQNRAIANIDVMDKINGRTGLNA